MQKLLDFLLDPTVSHSLAALFGALVTHFTKKAMAPATPEQPK